MHSVWPLLQRKYCPSLRPTSWPSALGSTCSTHKLHVPSVKRESYSIINHRGRSSRRISVSFGVGCGLEREVERELERKVRTGIERGLERGLGRGLEREVGKKRLKEDFREKLKEEFKKELEEDLTKDLKEDLCCFLQDFGKVICEYFRKFLVHARRP